MTQREGQVSQGGVCLKNPRLGYVFVLGRGLGNFPALGAGPIAGTEATGKERGKSAMKNEHNPAAQGETAIDPPPSAIPPVLCSWLFSVL